MAVLVTFATNGGVDHHLIVWPAGGVAIALSLPDAPFRRVQGICLYLAVGAGVFAGNLLSGMPWLLAVLIAMLTTIDLGVASLLLATHVRSFDDLKRTGNVVRLLLASTLAPLCTVLLGHIRVAAYLKTPPLTMAIMSALADALGIAIFVPVLLFLYTGQHLHGRRPAAKTLPLLLSCALFAGVCVGTFWQTRGPFLFLIFPATLILILASGLEGALVSSLVILSVGSFATAHGHGPICLSKTSSPNLRLVTLQVFAWVSVLATFPIAAVVDERRKAELSVTISRSLQRAILKHTREAIVISSLDGRERYASAGIEQITGWTPSEFLSMDRMLTVHPDDRGRAQDMLESLSHDVRSTSLRYRIMHKDGGSSWVEGSVSVHGEDQDATYVGTVRDIAALIETEQGWIEDRRALSEEQRRLTEAENAATTQIRLRDEFLSNVSHELRSPLTSIYSFSSIIADGLAGETTPEQNQYLDIILKNVVQLQSMIEDLLTVTRSNEGKLNIELQAVSLVEAVENAVDTVRCFAGYKQITLAEDYFVDESPVLYADPIRVCQILIILLDNAIKFTPDHGKVSVAITLKDPNTVLITVTDTGCGIPEDKWTLIFDKLYQVGGPARHDTSTSGRTGLGLGLHIARSLVVRQSGHIWVTSVPGQGSVFHFTLPIYKQQEHRQLDCPDNEQMQTETDFASASP